MKRALNAKMLSKLTRYIIKPGAYDADNNWVAGRTIPTIVWGVIKAGNKFSQFEEGDALRPEDGGARFSRYRSLYITDKFTIDIGDKIGFKGKYYNILQQSDEGVYGFNSYIVEKSEDWTP